MARNDGKDYAITRNGTYTRSQIGNIERHNERKNETYQNIDVQLDQSNQNIYFKKPTDTYLSTFDKMCEEGIISTKGHRDQAIIIDELLCDVNTGYFEKHGGYDFAKEFYQKAYDFAVKEVGGESYILSAVMHADERNKVFSEKLGKDVFHYHLHIVYVPVVQKEVKWSKRCKDKSLIGTVKETITQVSHSKKWVSHKVIGSDGKPYLQKSYSLLQDRFYNHMRNCGYQDIERGEKGSTEENLSTIAYKVAQEELRLQDNITKALACDDRIAKQSEIISKGKLALKETEHSLTIIKDKRTKIKAIDSLETKSQFMDKNKVVIDKSDFEEVKILAKKQLITESKEQKLLRENRVLRQEKQTLEHTNIQQSKELLQFKSVTNQLKGNTDKIRIKELEKLINLVMNFLDLIGYRKNFEQYKQSKKSNKRLEKQ